MTDRLKKLGKQDLLEVILDLSKKNNELKQQVEEQKTEIESLKEQLSNKNIVIENAGSLAEASLRLNGVFESAQAAAKQYLDNLQELYDRERVNVRQREKDTRLQCATMIIEAEDKCFELKEKTMKECEKMKLLAKIEVEEYWDNVLKKLDAYSKTHDELKSILARTRRY